MRAAIARLRSAAWLGWQIDTNWADPFLFIVYSLLRPIATGLILAGMYWAVSSRVPARGMFTALYLGNAFHNFVTQVVIGMGWIVLEEREEYETLKYVFTSPLGLPMCLAGRSVVKLAIAMFGVVVVMAVGWFALHLTWDWREVRWPELSLALALGVVATVSVGFLVAGLGLLLPRPAIQINEGLAVALYLMCGVIFPIDLLPAWLQSIALALPFTLWYEALRRFLLGHGASARISHWSDATLLGALALSTLAFVAIGRLGYFALETRARRLGRLDQTTLF
ncbi:MAG: ABC transporter permease [Candidatus Eisenbacteria bacterium]|nr:ABC transporter permease [Candidatus Eisenbacteria bacterium]